MEVSPEFASMAELMLSNPKAAAVMAAQAGFEVPNVPGTQGASNVAVAPTTGAGFGSIFSGASPNTGAPGAGGSFGLPATGGAGGVPSGGFDISTILQALQGVQQPAQQPFAPQFRGVTGGAPPTTAPNLEVGVPAGLVQLLLSQALGAGQTAGPPSLGSLIQGAN